MNRRPRLSLPVVNFEAALDRMEGNRLLLAEMITIYMEDAPDLIADIERGIALRDLTLVRRSAHSLKGLAANIDGGRVVDVAADLEHTAGHAQHESIEPLLATLRVEMETLRQALTAFRP